MTSTTSGCWEVSVEHDATYCIEGPICSGSGLEPAGSLCPVKGDVATADCHSYLASYAGDDSCALPVDTTCEVIKTGAWGCVLSSSSSASGEGDAGVGSGSAAGNATITTLAATDAASTGGLSAGAVAGIAAVAAAVCAVAGVAIYNQHQKNAAEAEHVRQTTFVDVVTP
ncbi:hypothetical protein BBJ29_003239 [Phytophthora kernoviae]|uniref:Uncharacterized protein n=1 Tax=Phytophthora kernoviae TaxID=325452 RepID=A0A3F2RQF7_9STRA|nr:hypothetical protein BBJ29_003239 [Phytophthora kernoviae]RLN62176.1 hypothetical protein BBP00_00004935 [Phytophthora kernoviae]